MQGVGLRLDAFQSTPPRGGRRLGVESKYAQEHFNPRPRVGGDIADMIARTLTEISIHAPHEGGDPG